jgi:hypothetical protein
MIKKAIYIFIAVYFLTSAIGVSLQINHCDRQSSSAKMVMSEDCLCDMACGMCEFESQYIHLEADFLLDQSEIRTQYPIVWKSVEQKYFSFISSQKEYIKLPLKHFNPLSGHSKRLALIQFFRC